MESKLVINNITLTFPKLQKLKKSNANVTTTVEKISVVMYVRPKQLTTKLGETFQINRLFWCA